MLLCLYEGVTAGDIDDLSQLHGELILLSSSGRYVGWALHHPFSYLGRSGAAHQLDYATSANMCTLVTRLFDLVNEDTMDALYDGDAELRAALTRLRDDARQAGDLPGFSLVEKRLGIPRIFRR